MPTDSLFARLKTKARMLLPQPKPPDPNEFVTIASFLPIMRPQLDILCSGLEAVGIAYMELRSRRDFVRLQVRRADATEAEAILAEMENSRGNEHQSSITPM